MTLAHIECGEDRELVVNVYTSDNEANEGERMVRVQVVRETRWLGEYVGEVHTLTAVEAVAEVPLAALLEALNG